MNSLWVQHPSIVLSFLGLMNVLLSYYVYRNLSVLSNLSKKSVEQRHLIALIKQNSDPDKKKILVKSYEDKGYAAKDLLALRSGSKKAKHLALKRFCVLSSPGYLYEITKLLDDKDDYVALHAFRVVLKQSNAVGIQLLQKVIFRGNKRKLLLISSLYKLAKVNPQILLDILNMEIAEWKYIACIKCLARVKDPRLMPLLVNAQEHSSVKIQSCAKAILDKMLPSENLIAA